VPAAELAVIGGSGFYELLEDATTVEPDTPWGPPSSPITVGHVEGVEVAFLARHGARHTIPPHLIEHRANLWALRELGVRRVIGPCAVGSLRAELAPGHFVVLDQLVDRTHGRSDTYLDGPVVDHVSFADPYCPELGARLAAAGERQPGVTLHRGGTAVVIQGPRFSTRAESRWFRSQGWDVVNMTQYPEAYLARELGLCYAGLATVTDYDTGLEEDGGVAPVTMDAVMAVLADNVTRTRALLLEAIPSLTGEPACGCATGGAPSLRRR
jgi:5'-methylthioadenosine phosphorylase